MICGLVLAAGEGTRFGPEPKLLAELDGRPLLKYAVDAQSAVAELSRVLVVLGAHDFGIAAMARSGSLVRAATPDGREIPTESEEDFNGLHRFGLAVPPGARSVDLTFAVVRSRFVEFTVHPSRP